MNTFRKEYGESGIRVFHYTEVLQDLLESGALKVTGGYGKKVVYHDPCFLGKQNNLFDDPRDLLRAALGEKPLEFSRLRENSLCCEGGGGRMFYDVEALYQRNSETRVKEALEMGAEVIATSCPFCVMNLEDPATEKGLAVKELSEILLEVI
jgi:Fe-S oxidoreductase